MTNDLIRQRVRGDQSGPHLVIAFARRHGSWPGSGWGHTAFWDSERRVFNEALLFQGVVQTAQWDWFDRYAETELVAVRVPDPAAGVRFAREQVGKRYDYLGALGVPWRRDWQDPARWYCSEKDAAILVAAQRPLPLNPDHGVHPQRLRVALSPKH